MKRLIQLLMELLSSLVSVGKNSKKQEEEKLEETTFSRIDIKNSLKELENIEKINTKSPKNLEIKTEKKPKKKFHLPSDVVVLHPINIADDLPRHTTKKYKSRYLLDIKRIVVHGTNWDTTPQRLAKYDIGPNHISKTGCAGITYHEIIMKDGTLYHTLSYKEMSWHVGMWNKGSLGIALMYKCKNDIGEDVYAPTDKALQVLQKRCGDLCLTFGFTPDKVVGHRELKGTGWFFSKGSKVLRKTCPGTQVDLNLLRNKIGKYMQLVLQVNNCYDGEIDGIFGEKSKEALKGYKNV